MSALDAFREAMQQRGLIPPADLIADGKLHRCNAQGKNGTDDGTYVLHLDERPAGGIQNWQDGQGWQPWNYVNGHGPLTAGERAALAEKIKADKLAAAREAEKRHAEAATRAVAMWAEATPALVHDYLDRKRIQPHGVRLLNGALVIPIRGENGALRSLQFINADGTKRYLAGGEIRGGYFSIGKPDGTICLGEGFATMASVHQATGHACAIAFDCGNLEPVAKALRAKFPDAKLIVCADDDHLTPGNPGLTKARVAAVAVDGVTAVPAFSAGRSNTDTDFNDLAVAAGLEAVAMCIDAAEHALPKPWGEPDTSLLESDRGDVPTLPLEVFSPLWRTWIEDTAQGAGSPMDYVALSLVASVAGIGGCGVVVRATEKWSEPLILWVAAIGKPSTGKSPALAATRKLVTVIERERQADDESRLRDHAQRAGVASAVTAKWQEELKDAIKKDLPAPDKPLDAASPEPFVPNQLVISDTTIEAVADVLRGNTRGLILWRDELNAWLANMSRYNGGSDQAQWLEAWPAAALTVNRKNKPPLVVPRFAVSILGGLQPDRLADVLDGADDGLAVRFLFGWPDPAPHVPPSLRRAGVDDLALDRLRWIERTAGTAETPTIIMLNDDAKSLLDEFSGEHYADAQGLDGFEAGFFGKGLGHVLRLAGVLALLEASEYPGPGPVVTGDLFRRAAGLWQGYFWPHAKAALRVGGRTPRQRLERKVLLQLRATGANVARREDVRRTILGGTINASQTDALMASLTAAGWTRPISPPAGPGRPATRWEINPALFEGR